MPSTLSSDDRSLLILILTLTALTAIIVNVILFVMRRQRTRRGTGGALPRHLHQAA